MICRWRLASVSSAGAPLISCCSIQETALDSYIALSGCARGQISRRPRCADGLRRSCFSCGTAGACDSRHRHGGSIEGKTAPEADPDSKAASETKAFLQLARPTRICI